MKSEVTNSIQLKQHLFSSFRESERFTQIDGLEGILQILNQISFIVISKQGHGILKVDDNPDQI